MPQHSATAGMRNGEALQSPPKHECATFYTEENRSAAYGALKYHVLGFLKRRAASAAIVATQLPSSPTWHLARKRCDIFRQNLWLKFCAKVAPEKNPACDSHAMAFYTDTMYKCRSWTTAAGNLQFDMNFLCLAFLKAQGSDPKSNRGL